MWASEYISKVRSGWENIYILHTLCLNGFDQFVAIKVCMIDFLRRFIEKIFWVKISFKKFFLDDFFQEDHCILDVLHIALWNF